MRSSIPTPSISVLEIGPLSIHAYALCIIAGVALAIWLSNKRFTAAFPQTSNVVSDVALVAVPAGVIGGRLYHVVTTPERFFGSPGSFIEIFKIWEGGLGIWGAIALGALGAYIAYRRIARVQDLPSFTHFADAVAPGIIFAQAIGRWGNWFNGELFGKPTDLPWGLEIPIALRPIGYGSFETFHPTFLYESLWSIAVGVLLLRLTGKLQPGQLFAIYVIGYCIGRLGMEFLRIDSSHHFLGLRVNVFVALGLSLSSLLTFRRLSRSPR